jgi:hypothetical protein
MGNAVLARARNADFRQNLFLERGSHERVAKLYRMVEAALPSRTGRIEPIIHYKVLILSLLFDIFPAVSFQCSFERTAPYQTGSRGRSITNTSGENPP